MEYNIYVDLFFLLNFIMNVLVLLSLCKLLRRQCPVSRLLFSGAAGAGISVPVLLWSLEGCFFTGAGLGIAFCMVRILFPKETWKKSLLYSWLLYFLAFTVEGAMEYTKSPGGALFVPVLCALAGGSRRMGQQEMTVELHFRGRKKRLLGFYDSGNLLSEPLTGKMVHIACYDEIKELLPEGYRQAAQGYFQKGFLESTKVVKLQMYEFTFLSYHSIGTERGQLLGIRMDRAVIKSAAGEKTEEKPVIGLVEQPLFAGKSGRMIMNGRLEL